MYFVAFVLEGESCLPQECSQAGGKTECGGVMPKACNVLEGERCCLPQERGQAVDRECEMQ